jgi:hypothetical protein
MTTLKWLASASLAAATFPAICAEPHCPGNVASLRFRPVQRSQIIVPIKINHNGPYDFLVDTGAQVSTVDPALAAELHLKLEGTVGFVGVGFRTHHSFSHLDILEAGPHAIRNPWVVIQSLEFLQLADPHIRGILGGNFLEHFDVLIDYAHGILCLDDAKVMQPEVKGRHIALITPPHPNDAVLSTEPLIVPIYLTGFAGRALRVLLDVGKDVASGFSVSLPIRARGPDGIERVFSVLQAGDMQIGTLTFHGISFVTPTAARNDVPRFEVDGLLPTALFRRVYISYADRFVILEPW